MDFFKILKYFIDIDMIAHSKLVVLLWIQPFLSGQNMDNIIQIIGVT